MTLIRVSGRGLKSLWHWLKDSSYARESHPLVVAFERRQHSGNDGRKSFAVSFRPRPSRTRLLLLALLLTSLGWRLTWWFSLRAGSKSSGTRGEDGAGNGGPLTPSTTKQGHRCYFENRRW